MIANELAELVNEGGEVAGPDSSAPCSWRARTDGAQTAVGRLQCRVVLGELTEELVEVDDDRVDASDVSPSVSRIVVSVSTSCPGLPLAVEGSFGVLYEASERAGLVGRAGLDGFQEAS